MAKLAPDPISWKTAHRVAARVGGREPFSSSYLGRSLDQDFTELTRIAEELVEAETGLVADGPARVEVVDRARWAQVNLAAFDRLLRPVTRRMAAKPKKSRFVAPTGRVVTGAQIGVVLGWMSTRVLGQYDLLLLEDERPEDQDWVYYVGPNVLALEKRFAFPPREFRLWLALHECAHRAQFTGVPWLPDYFRELVDELLSMTDPEKLDGALSRTVEELKGGRNPLADGGLLQALSSPEQRDALQRIQGLMALLEGHGEVTMSRAGRELVPSAERFHRVMQERRSSATGIAKVMQKLLGIDAKLRQYADGERFLEQLEERGGKELARRVWEGREMLPTQDEIRDPRRWIQRVGA